MTVEELYEILEGVINDGEGQKELVKDNESFITEICDDDTGEYIMIC